MTGVQTCALPIWNGFSINVENKFCYDSIIQILKSNISHGYKEDFEKVQKSLKTTNIEYLLSNLIKLINLGKDLAIINDESLEKMRKLYQLSQEGLIKAITDTNPKYTELNINKLIKITDEINKFNNIFTLNYDTLLYHIIMLHNDKYEKDETEFKFSDYFRYVDSNLVFYECAESPEYKYVYYLHGALFLYKSLNGNYTKVKADESSPLLDVISSRISENKFPIFVCEGETDDKKRYIMEDHYLSFCLRKFKTEGSIVVYGMSFCDSDSHIIEILKQYKSKIAISIFKGNKADKMLIDEKKRIQSKIHKFGEKIKFFDSSTLFNVANVI